ncbi:MAG: gamma-glutamylcyclotransferase [Gammaproteobacteria bacterium]|nr:gamma-glutamylcyclotransferase [Gammaproteobacteria bacterium]
MRKEPNLVSCYGTLKSGFHNHHLLSGSKFLGNIKTAADFTMYDLGSYPAVIESGDSAIHGEVYIISDDTLAELDQLEGYPDFYNRILIQSTYGYVWMYVLNRPVEDRPVITSGRWLRK